MGKNTMICSYARLNGDKVHYASFPDGIPDQTPFGVFFGKQANAFLSDMGFDFIWFLNGIGFGKEAWSTVGAVFDGKSFHFENADDVQKLALDFRRDFRSGCPDYPIETRGTNMSLGIDASTDGIPLKSIYNGGFNMLPPPNSPWAALDGDFGLELMGHMSRIAEIPDKEYLFRYYIHDPWYECSPWYDRYNGQPHDIYLPMAVARIDADGKVQPPTNLNLFTVNNSFGNLPEACVYEPLPHLMKAEKEAPDAPSPVVWVYPFDEYSDCDSEQKAKEMFFGDWFIRNAINVGVPISTVVSTKNFITHDKSVYSSSIIVSVVPEAGSRYESEIIEFSQNGGKVIFIGNTTRASRRFTDFIGVVQLRCRVSWK